MTSIPTPTAADENGAADPGNVLKLYVDSTSLSLVEQMADYVRCADAPNVFKVITWLRVPLPEAVLVQHNAMYAPQLAAVSPEFVAAVTELVTSNPVHALEIHSNQTHAWRGVVPLLRALLPHLQQQGIPIKLHLYDDGSLSVLQRETLKAEPDLPAALQRASQGLLQALQGRVAPSTSVLHSHAWHLLFDTTYHMLRRDLLCADEAGRAVLRCFDAHAVDIAFDLWPTLDEAQQRLYLALFGIDEALRQQLQAWADDPQAWLFTGSAAWDRPLNERLGQAQLRTIAALRASDTLPASARVGLKAHPANAAYTPRLLKALGEGAQELPSQVPLEVLMMAGLLPRQIAGVLSSAFFNLPPERIRFVICDAPDRAAALALPLVQQMLQAGAFSPEQVMPWAAEG